MNDIPVNIRATTAALMFLDSTKLVKNYENDLFVANRRVIYHFDLNKNRTALKLPNSNSVVAENQDSHSIPLVEGIGKPTDMQVCPDGIYMFYQDILTKARSLEYQSKRNDIELSFHHTNIEIVKLLCESNPQNTML